MKKRYTNVVNQDNIPAVLPAECQMSSIAVTLGHWCHQKSLDQPHVSKQSTPNSQIFSLEYHVDDDSDDDSIPTVPPTQSIFKIDTMEIPMDEVDHSVEHCVLYVDAKQRNQSYTKCKLCGMPGHDSDSC